MSEKTFLGRGIPERTPASVPRLYDLDEDIDDEDTVVVDVECRPVVYVPPSQRVAPQWESFSFFIEPVPDPLTFFAEPYIPSPDLRDETAAQAFASLEKEHPDWRWQELRDEAYRLADEQLLSQRRTA